MGGGDQCYLFVCSIATVDVLMANSNDVNLAKTSY